MACTYKKIHKTNEHKVNAQSLLVDELGRLVINSIALYNANMYRPKFSHNIPHAHTKIRFAKTNAQGTGYPQATIKYKILQR